MRKSWSKGVTAKGVAELTKKRKKRQFKEKIDKRCFTCQKEDCKGYCEAVR